ncbi:MAG: hypothetical protein QXS81_05025 [Candidatus Micrarchaeaceae archaeon]
MEVQPEKIPLSNSFPSSVSNIIFDQSNRTGIIDVLFQMPPELINWIASVFYDSHLTGNTLFPNVDFYECPTCKAIKPTATGAIQLYGVCKGTKDNPHPPTTTIPMDWRPITSKKGITYLLGEINSLVNSNISTANFQTSESDVKKNASIEDNMLLVAFDKAQYVMASMIDNRTEYLADWLLKDEKTLLKTFNMNFIASVLVSMTKNIQAAMSKGKSMAAVKSVVENRARVEQEITNKTERQEATQQISQSNGGLFSGIKNIFAPQENRR